MSYVCARKTFATLDAAKAHADKLFRTKGVVAGIEEKPAKKKKKRDAYAVAAELAKMPKLDDIAEFGPKILALMKGVPWAEWIKLDEKPGLFGYMDDRFYMLRRVRNDPVFSKLLFAGLSERTPNGARA